MIHRVVSPRASLSTRRRLRGGILAWLLVTVLLVAGFAVFAGIYLVSHVRVHESTAVHGQDVQVETPFGSVHVQHNGKSHPESVGLPVYPGARPVSDDRNASVDISSTLGDKDLHIVTGKWETSDSLDQVRRFYEARFPEMSVVRRHDILEMHSLDGSHKRVISLRERGSGTEITLASVGEPKAN